MLAWNWRLRAALPVAAAAGLMERRKRVGQGTLVEVSVQVPAAVVVGADLAVPRW